jgi:hypothetical protein
MKNDIEYYVGDKKSRHSTSRLKMKRKGLSRHMNIRMKSTKMPIG